MSSFRDSLELGQPIIETYCAEYLTLPVVHGVKNVVAVVGKITVQS